MISASTNHYSVIWLALSCMELVNYGKLYLSLRQLFVAILWLWEGERPLRYHVPSAGNRMALTAASQTAQLQDSW